MIALSNYYKRTPKNWKIIGDVCLFIAPLLTGVVMAAPFGEPLKSWILFGINIILITGKIVTKFIGVESIEPIEET